MRFIRTITISRQAKAAICALPTYVLAFASSANAAGSPVSNQERLISIHRTLFDIYQRQQKFEDALSEGEILESLTKDQEVSKALGKMLFSKQRCSEALTHYQRALEFGASLDEVGGSLVPLLMQLNRHDEAVAMGKRITSARVAKDENLHPLLTLPAASGSDIAWRASDSKTALRTSMINDQGRQMQPVALLPASARRISITLNRCDFKLVHETRSDILLIANYPNHWKSVSGSQTQIGLGSYPVGHFRTINGENSWTGDLIISPDGITLDGRMFQKFPVGANKLDFPVSDDLLINQEKVRIGPIDLENKSEADIVQLLVPLNYVGDLELRTNVDTKGDYWSGGICLFAGRPSTVRFEKVTQDFRGEIDTSGYVNLLINKLEAKQVGLSATNESLLKIDFVKASEVTLTARDGGKIEIQSGTVDCVHTDGITKNILFKNSVTESGK